jgi:hypothetical protein
MFNCDDIFASYSLLPEVGIAVITAEGRILRANDHFANMIAVSDAQIHDVSYFGLLLPQDQKRELAAFATLLDRSKQSYSQENRLYLDHAFADHYDGMLHVMCQVTRYDGAEASFFLVMMDELKVYRHFRKPRVEP